MNDNPETYVLTHNRFNTYIVLIFTDLKKAQIYKMPYRNSPHQEIEIVISFDYLHFFGPDENNKDEIVDYFIEHGKENIYFMLHQKYIPLQEYEKRLSVFV